MMESFAKIVHGIQTLNISSKFSIKDSWQVAKYGCGFIIALPAALPSPARSYFFKVIDFVPLFLLVFWTDFTRCSSVSIFDFEQVDVSWILQ